MSNDRIKVSGYAKRVFFNDNIEYRNFSPDLVGLQLVADSDSNSSLFTFGNFRVTTNVERRNVLNYPTKPFSKHYTIDDLGGTDEINNQSLFNINKITLNTDNSEISNFAYFGSATEFVRVSLENIIKNWVASLYVTPIDIETGNSIYNVLDYQYNQLTDTSKFKVFVNGIINNFDLIYDTSGFIVNSFDNDIKNLTINYPNYVLLYDNIEYKVIGFTPSNNTYNDVFEIIVNGNPFNIDSATNLYRRFHIKPNKTHVEKFFKGLSPFENNLLNRLTTPKYTSSFKYSVITDTGLIYNAEKTLTWPTSDGYNIDFNTNEYISYVSELIKITDAKDAVQSNLIVRFLTSESISNFDTIPRCDGIEEEETAGQKMNKTLKIYGRQYDEIKKYIDGISFVRTVTYDKKDNIPDELVKYLANTLGWDITNSIENNNLVNVFLTKKPTTYLGQSTGLTPQEAEVELWRRLILNSAWLWKSKGTRKAIEFLFKLIGIPKELIALNEHVYVAEDKVDVDKFFDILDAYGLPISVDNYNIDPNGYPKALPDTPDMYFQKGGLWYRETYGQNADKIILKGNNPHYGPYDGGYEYINRFESLIPDFEPITLSSTTTTISSVNLFTNYNEGIVNNYSGDTFVDIVTSDGLSFDDCYVYTSDIINSPNPKPNITECGCELPEEDLVLYINVNKFPRDVENTCENRFISYRFIDNNDVDFGVKPNVYNWDYKNFNIDGTLSNVVNSSTFVQTECCKSIVNGNSFLYDEYVVESDTDKATFINSGFICCKKPTSTDIITPSGNNFNPNSIRGNIIRVDKRDTGCGCYIACKWRLSSPRLGDMYILNNEKYLKFVTPKNNWGQDGEPEYRLTVESDSCACPPPFTIPNIITDPYTNKLGYGCKLNDNGKKLLTIDGTGINGTINNMLYQLFYLKSIGQISCLIQELFNND
jgi:hypothetical protein